MGCSTLSEPGNLWWPQIQEEKEKKQMEGWKADNQRWRGEVPFLLSPDVTEEEVICWSSPLPLLQSTEAHQVGKRTATSQRDGLSRRR